jgi:protein TonB
MSMPHAPHDLPPPSDRRDWLPSRRGLLLTAIAFLIGLALFTLFWRSQARQDFYTVEPVARPSADGEFDPLPAPLPANRDRGASGMGERGREDAREDERIASEREREEPLEPVATIEPTPMPEPAPAPTPVASEAPVPVHTPAPNYPRRALRRGVEGTVLVRVDVGPDGVPTAVGISRSSRSRDLDRAAIEAVQRWRFRPAMADGRPTVGSVVVPIDFEARR